VELDELIAPGLERTVAHLRATVEAAALTAEDLDGVVLAGGSARLPLVAERLSADLGRPIVVAPRPELTAALGAARLAAEAAATATGGAAEALPGAAAPVPDRHLVPSTRRPRVRAAASGPPSVTGSRGPLRSPAGAGGHRAVRLLVVAGMFAGLVLLVPTLTTIFSAEPGPPPRPADAAEPADAAHTGTPADAATPDPGAGGVTGSDVPGAQASADAGPRMAVSGPRRVTPARSTVSTRAAGQHASTAPATGAARTGTAAPSAASPAASAAPGTSGTPGTPGTGAPTTAGGTEPPSEPTPGSESTPDPTPEPTPPPTPEPTPEPAPETEPAPVPVEPPADGAPDGGTP
jgi:molecular chaperone DnaK